MYAPAEFLLQSRLGDPLELDAAGKLLFALLALSRMSLNP